MSVHKDNFHTSKPIRANIFNVNIQIFKKKCAYLFCCVWQSGSITSACAIIINSLSAVSAILPNIMNAQNSQNVFLCVCVCNRKPDLLCEFNSLTSLGITEVTAVHTL